MGSQNKVYTKKTNIQLELNENAGAVLVGFAKNLNKNEYIAVVSGVFTCFKVICATSKHFYSQLKLI